jgi:hypothetical protein
MVWSRDGPGVGPVAVYARVAYSCTYGAGLRPLGVSSAHRPSFSGHTLLCVPHIELISKCALCSGADVHVLTETLIVREVSSK